ncbi:zinc finger CCCH domain-containing protein 6-like [Impatiens glandulifera]|uniref:zinc finger CCCH domain-containing protein 6-like n=1 Tax=Impatiens glandulifera TaxID=253017 RepID=UPI001FB15905|nr:zinc finger CCCH domain-containing protein 6-like [Impatiens glandulifera]
MRGLQKSKRVSWASDLNLCQVKLFLSDDSPSQIGLVSGEDNLQAKSLWHQQSIGTGSDENLPPGFEGTHSTSLINNKLSQIPVIKWRCPPKFMLDQNWLMVSGEESQEVEVQNQREMRVLEAIYPRPSSVPPDPSPLLNMDDFPLNDKNTPLIPITPIEDEEAIVDTPLINDSTNRFNPTNNNGIASTSEPDVVTAAYNALTSIMPSGDQSLIDHDLLVKILNDPKTMENLLADHRATTNLQNPPNPRIQLSDPNPNQNQVQVNRNEPAAPFYQIPSNRVGPISNIGPSAPLAKDMNYYKSLIQQHGGERTTDNAPLPPPPQFGNRQSQSHQVGPTHEFSNHKPRDSSKHKIMKPCMFFNSSRGCRHGANCAFQHEPSPQPQREVQASKRMKFDREITG